MILQPLHVSDSPLSGNGMNGSQVRVGSTESNGRQNVEARRRALLGLIQGKRITQRDLARRLGVSIRTIRNDVAALRREGFLAGKTLH